jgi:hypothetical protein
MAGAGSVLRGLAGIRPGLQLFIDNLRAYQANEALRGEVDFSRGY